MEKKRKDVDPNKMDRKDDYYFQNWLIYMYFLKIFIIISIFIQYFFFITCLIYPLYSLILAIYCWKIWNLNLKSEVPSELIN